MTRKITKTATIDYLLFLPRDYNKNKDKYPLVLFLHGAGERGDDLERVKVHGPPKEILAGRKFPFIVVAPQCPENSSWDNDTLLALLDEIEERHRIDKSRVYVTGLSMGGQGTWELASRAPERFAAVVPICGFGNRLTVGRMKSVPTWAFHGDQDAAVPISQSQVMVDALKAAGGDVKFTIIPGGGHDVWTDIYHGTEIYDWLLSHRRK